MATLYKFVELTTVTDQTLEDAVNEWVAQGWQLDRIQFVVTEHSRRPGMAFVAFVRERPDAGAEADASPPRVSAQLAPPDDSGGEYG